MRDHVPNNSGIIPKSAAEAPEAGTVVALRGWRIAEVGLLNEPPITPPPGKLQARQESYPPWIDRPKQPRSASSSRLHRSRLSSLLPFIPQRTADHPRGTLHPHCQLVTCRPLTEAVILFDVYVLCSAFGASVGSITSSSASTTTLQSMTNHSFPRLHHHLRQ